MISTIKLLSSLLLVCSVHVFAGSSMEDLIREGTLLRLQGDFASAEKIESALINSYEEPVGHVFALNTIITHLTWDDTTTLFDASLASHANKTLDWCDQKLRADPTNVKANYYCGQAHFALSYYHALKEHYYQAGKHGSRCIEHLERALLQEPTLVDAKMHLGVAYYAADNLPPFIKMFSRLLWFVPTGNSKKSLPYLQDVMERGDQYRDVARYIYSVILLDDPDFRADSERQLRQLVSLYPRNKRFQLRLISVLLMRHNYFGTLEAANAYLNNDVPPIEPDLSLAKIWMVRAYLGLNQPDEAAKLFSEIEVVFAASEDDLPGWSIAWYLLTSGQLHDLAERRHQAREVYADIISLGRTAYVNEVIVDAARAGLLIPYQSTAP